jgi:hypothetical protein
VEQLLDLMFQLLDQSLGLWDHVRLLINDLVAEDQIIGERLAGVAHAKILQSSCPSKHNLSGDFEVFSRVVLPPPDTTKIDSVEDHHQVHCLHLDIPGYLSQGPEAEVFSLRPLVPHSIPIPVPVQDLYLISITAAGNKQVA